MTIRSISGDSLGHTALSQYELAIHALGGLTWYLCESQLDIELLSMRNFVEYVPMDCEAPIKSEAPSFTEGRQRMVRHFFK